MSASPRVHDFSRRRTPKRQLDRHCAFHGIHVTFQRQRQVVANLLEKLHEPSQVVLEIVEYKRVVYS